MEMPNPNEMVPSIGRLHDVFAIMKADNLLTVNAGANPPQNARFIGSGKGTQSALRMFGRLPPVYSPGAKCSRLLLGFAEFGANRCETGGEFCFEPAIDGAVVFAVDAEIVLGRDSPFVVVGVLVAFTVTKSLRAGVVLVAQMDRHGQHPPFADILASFADRDRGRV